MRHTEIEEWSRRRSYLHARDARAKLIPLIVFLIAVGTTPPQSYRVFAAYGLLLLLAIGLTRLPIRAFLLRSMTVLPFVAVFALAAWWSGDPTRAAALVMRSLLSAAAVLLVVATTPAPQLFGAMERMGVPAVLAAVIQAVYRYLFVLAGQARDMKWAAACRSGTIRGSSFASAAALAGVLFARSYERAGSVHRAMLARGYSGRAAMLTPPRPLSPDLPFVASAAALTVAIRLAI